MDGDVRKKDGKELVIRDVIPTGVVTSASEAQIVQVNLAEIGVKVNIDSVPTEGFFDKNITPGDFDITHFSWIGTVTPVLSSKSILGLSKDPKDIQQNFGRIGNDTINGLLDQANQELDDVKRAALANQADVELWKIGHSLLLYQRPNTIGVTDNLANFGAFGFADKDYTAIGFIK
jgi:ABC-type transport system substrate-binding protein